MAPARRTRIGQWCVRGLLLSATVPLFSACVPWYRAPRSAMLDMVAEKKNPLTLVATSGRTCLADPITYSATKIGAMHQCAWTETPKSRVSPTPAPAQDFGVRRGAGFQNSQSGERPWWWGLLRLGR